MTHHFSPEFRGYRECNYCGEVRFIDDLNTDLLCDDCATAKCGRCEYTFKRSELVEDNIHGLLCRDCTETVTEERLDRIELKQTISNILNHG